MKKVLILGALLLAACAGPKGDNGAQGNDGQQGPSGAVGLDGNQIQPIQFCPGVPSYPSTFPEVGLCINGNIYAVYSANGGFLTLTPPGRYSSDAVGSRCTFTILPGCEVDNGL